jgi:hypothetical protein
MSAVPINYLAVVIAAVAGFLVGCGWYTASGKIWQHTLGKKTEDCKPTPLPFIIAAVGCPVDGLDASGANGSFGGRYRSRRRHRRLLRLGRLRADHNRHQRGLSWHQAHCDSHRYRPLAGGARRHGRDRASGA